MVLAIVCAVLAPAGLTNNDRPTGAQNGKPTATAFAAVNPDATPASENGATLIQSLLRRTPKANAAETDDPTFGWARQSGGADDDSAYGTAVDALRNVYTTGYFYETADFYPGPGTFDLTSAGAV